MGHPNSGLSEGGPSNSPATSNANSCPVKNIPGSVVLDEIANKNLQKSIKDISRDQSKLQQLTIFRRLEAWDKLEFEYNPTCQSRKPMFKLATYLRYHMMGLKSLSVDAYFFLGHQKPVQMCPNQEHEIIPMLTPAIESVYIKDISKDTLSIFWSWLKAVTLSKSRKELPNLQTISYSFIERLNHSYPSALIKANIFLTCPRAIVSALESAGIDLEFIRISQVVVEIDDGATYRELKYLRLDDGHDGNNKEEELHIEETTLLDLIDQNSAFNNPKEDDLGSDDSESDSTIKRDWGTNM